MGDNTASCYFQIGTRSGKGSAGYISQGGHRRSGDRDRDVSRHTVFVKRERVSQGLLLEGTCRGLWEGFFWASSNDELTGCKQNNY